MGEGFSARYPSPHALSCSSHSRTARAACNPDIRIILADEPTAHLDAATAADITESLIHLAKGKTLVVATHDPRLAARMQRVIAIGAETLREAAE